MAEYICAACQTTFEAPACHRRKYPAGSVLNLRHLGGVAVEAVWARDAEKAAAAVGKGYRVVAVWEDEFKAGGMEAVWRAIE